MINDRVSDITSAGNLVRVRIPVRAAKRPEEHAEDHRLGSGQLGCEGCHSGFDICYDVVREFVVNEQLDVKAVGG